MECLAKDPVLKFHHDTLREVRRAYNLDEPGKISEAIDILLDWIQKQPHFMKKDFCRDYLERTIVASKGSIERAKQRLTKYCSTRTMIPKFFDKVNIKTEFEDFLKTYHLVALPQLTKDHERVFLVKLGRRKHTSDVVLDFYNYSVIFGEYLKLHDYPRGFIMFFDYTDFNMLDLVAHINPIDLKYGLSLFLEGYGMRLQGIHALSTSNSVQAFLALVKKILSAKIIDRIHIHPTMDTIYPFIPKEMLPAEYGGKEMSVVDLREKWLDILGSDEHIKHLEEMKEAKINEKYRSIEEYNEQYIGMPGTFRILNLD